MDYYNFDNFDYRHSEQFCKRCEPTIPLIPKDEETPELPPANITQMRSTMILPYSTDNTINLEVDSVSGKPSNICTICFGAYSNVKWFVSGGSEDRFNTAFGDAVHAFSLPEDIWVENIRASIQIAYDSDYQDAVFRVKLRLYKTDFAGNVYDYIEGTQIEFEPQITGNVKENDAFLARGDDLKILVEKESKFVLGIFLEGENISGMSGVSVKLAAAVSISTEQKL